MMGVPQLILSTFIVCKYENALSNEWLYRSMDSKFGPFWDSHVAKHLNTHGLSLAVCEKNHVPSTKVVNLGVEYETNHCIWEDKLSRSVKGHTYICVIYRNIHMVCKYLNQNK